MKLRAALGYAKRGWHVIPLHSPVGGGCSCKNADCTSVGKHPRTRHGVNDATTDEIQIREWFARWPDANIGVVTGAESALVVLDVDNKNGRNGSENLAKLAAECGGLPDTLTAITGTGKHLFFDHPGVSVKNGVSGIADGVDVRAERGYVVVEPSLHANGNRYVFEDIKQPITELPTWLLDRMTGMVKAAVHNGPQPNAFTEAPVILEGSRNDTLYRLGCSLRGQHAMESDQILAILLEYNSAKCDPPLEESEVSAIVESVCNHPAELGPNKSGKRLDLNPLYWFQFNTREWFSDQNLAIMTDCQTGWYIRLKAFAWDGGGFLPDDRDKLWKLAKAKSKRAFERDCKLVLAEYQKVTVNGEPMLKHSTMAARYADTLESWLKKKEAGDASKAAKLAQLQSGQQPASAMVQ